MTTQELSSTPLFDAYAIALRESDDDDLIERARDLWLDSDEPRQYAFAMDGYREFGFVLTPGEVVGALREWVADGDWSSDTTFWVSAEAFPVGPDGEIEDDDHSFWTRVRIDPDRPRCVADDHDWASPHSVLGGLVENPGVRGSGAGILIREVCSLCGVYRITDTGASDGSGNRTSVRYEDADDLSTDWVRSRELDEND